MIDLVRDYLLILVGTVLVNNFVLVRFLGLCPFIGVSRRLDSALGTGRARRQRSPGGPFRRARSRGDRQGSPGRSVIQ